MMNKQKAYEIALANSDKKILVEALEFKKSFAFLFVEKEGEFGGGSYIEVDKTSGKTSDFFPMKDMGKFMSGDVIEL